MSKGRGGRLTRLCWLCWSLAGAALPAPTWAGDLSESQVKAAFLYNFARFTEWPPARSGAFDICILGSDPFGAALAPYEGRIVAGREVRLRRRIGVDEAASCSILYVASSEARRLVPILRAVAGMPVLTVSDIDGFADAGGMIELLAVDDRIRFDVNLDSAGLTHLRFNANMLQAARRVIRHAERGR